MSQYEFKGVLYKKFDTENKTETFQKREFVIKSDGTYPQFIKFQLTQDRCQLIDEYKEGSMVQVHFNLRGNEWKDKYFTNLEVWKIDSMSDLNEVQPESFGEMPSPSDEIISSEQIPDQMDDLPF